MCCPGLQGDHCSGRGRGTANPRHHPITQGSLNMQPVACDTVPAKMQGHSPVSLPLIRTSTLRSEGQCLCSQWETRSARFHHLLKTQSQAPKPRLLLSPHPPAAGTTICITFPVQCPSLLPSWRMNKPERPELPLPVGRVDKGTPASGGQQSWQRLREPWAGGDPTGFPLSASGACPWPQEGLLSLSPRYPQKSGVLR